jgi:hypothetical protein
MIKDIILDEKCEDNGFSYHVVEGNDTIAYDRVSVEIREPRIYIFKFFLSAFDHESSFTIACYTLDEALHTFMNMYKGVKDFEVTVKE